MWKQFGKRRLNRNLTEYPERGEDIFRVTEYAPIEEPTPLNNPIASPLRQDEYFIYQKVQTGGKGKEVKGANLICCSCFSTSREVVDL